MFRVSVYSLIALVIVVSAQDDGKYRPEKYVYQGGDDGRYRPTNDGRYYPTGDGKYNLTYDGGFGHYTGDNGRYVHDYKGGDGAYKGTYDPYKHVEGKSGSDNKQQYNYKYQPAKVSAQSIYSSSQGSKNQGLFGQGSRQSEYKYNFIPAESIQSSVSKYGSSTQRNYFPSSKEATTYRPISESKYQPSPAEPRTKYINDNYRIIRLESEPVDEGFKYLYETENKILAQESGAVVNTGDGESNLRVSGFYEYVGDDGRTYHVDYTADENGYHPSGAHIVN